MIKVVCIKSPLIYLNIGRAIQKSDYAFQITVGKIYKANRNDDYEYYYLLTDDGSKKLIPAIYFETLEKYRMNKLNEVLNE